MAADLRFLSASFREEIGPDRRYTGRRDIVFNLTTESGQGRQVPLDEDQALQLIEQLAGLVNTARRLARERAEREATR